MLSPVSCLKKKKKQGEKVVADTLGWSWFPGAALPSPQMPAGAGELPEEVWDAVF